MKRKYRIMLAVLGVVAVVVLADYLGFFLQAYSDGVVSVPFRFECRSAATGERIPGVSVSCYRDGRNIGTFDEHPAASMPTTGGTAESRPAAVVTDRDGLAVGYVDLGVSTVRSLFFKRETTRPRVADRDLEFQFSHPSYQDRRINVKAGDLKPTNVALEPQAVK